MDSLYPLSPKMDESICTAQSRMDASISSTHTSLSRVGPSRIGTFIRTRETTLHSNQILVEIVSAWDLTPTTNSEKVVPYDPYCVCSVGGKVIHKTKSIPKTFNPVWTVKTNSLFLLDLLEHEDEISNGLKFEVKNISSLGIIRSHGFVNVDYATIVSGKSERKQFQLGHPSEGVCTTGTLALRFRSATKDDLNFMDTKTSHHVEYKLQKLKPDRRPLYFRPRSTEKTYRMKPYPDPENVENTTFLSQNQIDEECLKPSTLWTASGTGNVGRVFLEILKCDNLPNKDAMKTALGLTENVTDAFAKIIVEETCVETDFISNCLSPRWMPWTRRAFSLPIAHPLSPVLLGIFDCDPLESRNDPIGRVVVDLTRLRNKAENVLTFDLYEKPVGRTKAPFGTVTIRVQVEWKDESKLFHYFLSTPDRYLVNVGSEKEFAMVKYLCEGELDESRATLESISNLLTELGSYVNFICYCLDVILQIMLWRGKIKIHRRLRGPNSDKDEYEERSVYFPYQSIVCFLSGLLLSRHLNLIPTFICFTWVWVVSSIMVHRRLHPYPWKRCLTPKEIIRLTILKRTPDPNFHIDAYEGWEREKELQLLKQLKTDRIRLIFTTFIKTGLKYKRKYMKSDVNSISIETENNSWVFLGEYLYYIHLPIYYLCLLLRYINAWITWKLWPNAFFNTITLIVMGIVAIFLNWVEIVRWSMRIFVWIHGPWIILVDHKFIRPHFQTDEELLESKQIKPPTYFEAIFETEKLQGLKQIAEIALEDAEKLRDMRAVRYGRFSKEVPSSSNCTPYLDRPRPESYCLFKEPTNGNIHVDRVPGQKLHGNMVHTIDQYLSSKKKKSLKRALSLRESIAE